ncbi:MAG: cobaltochelatase CobT-related protein [Rhizobiaceae bacterium]
MRKLLRMLGIAQFADQKFEAETTYKIYSTDFDRIVDFSEIDTAIDALPSDQLEEHQDQIREFDRLLNNWQVLLQPMHYEMAERVAELATPDVMKKTIVTFLIDQSGSMKGSKMTHVAAMVALLVRWLNEFNCNTEVLGFTTRHWLGGRSRKIWKLDGRPRNPGRLNDVLHLIYHNADSESPWITDQSIGMMLRPDLLKENIDGEALEWAVGRLNAKPGFRKLLVMISDGAPVDDSTLNENTNDYMYKHVKSVIQQIEETTDIELWGMGIQYSVQGFYRKSEYAADLEDIPTQMIKLIERALTPLRL